jgi:aarF domain-containing kinase
MQHPGNIMLLKDGRIGLIDYGQVKRLDDKHRVLYAKFILALNKDDKEEIVRLYNKDMGIRTKDNLADVLYRHAVFYHDRDTADVMQGLNMHLFLEKLESDDPVRHISEEYVMVGRVNMLIRGISKAFGLELKMSDLWKCQAEEYLKSKNEL